MVIWGSSDNGVVIISFVILDLYDLNSIFHFLSTYQLKKKTVTIWIYPVIISFYQLYFSISPCNRLINTALVEWKQMGVGNEGEGNPVNDEPK